MSSSIEVKEIKKVKPLIVPEKVSGEAFVDPTTVWGLPSWVIPHWVNKNKLASNRSGYWVVIDKTHPDFKEVRVVTDDTPQHTMFTRGDLVLCGMHKDTYAQIEKRKIETVKRKTEDIVKLNKAKMDQIAKEGVGSLKTVLRNEAEEVISEEEKEE